VVYDVAIYSYSLPACLYCQNRQVEIEREREREESRGGVKFNVAKWKVFYKKKV
jgi:hypothetical protein